MATRSSAAVTEWGGEQSVPEDGPGRHVIAQEVILGEVGGRLEEIRVVGYALLTGGPGGGIHEAAESLAAVDLPGDDVRVIHVVVGGGVAPGDEDDRIAALPGEAVCGQGVAPGSHDAVFKAVQDLSGPRRSWGV